MSVARPRRTASSTLALLACTVLAVDIAAQSPPPNGPRSVDVGWHALVGATVIPEPGRVIEKAQVVIRDGRILAIGRGIEVPAGARVWDCSGHTLCAAFVEPWLAVETPRPEDGAPGLHWNPEVLPQRSILDGDGLADDLAKQLRGLGFATAAVVPEDGIFRGSAHVLSLEAVRDDETRPILASDTHQVVAFDRSRSGYPRALMGAIALVHQTLLDAHAQFDGRAETLDALRDATTIALDASDELDVLRLHRLRTQARPTLPAFRAIVLGSGTEFRRLDAVAATGFPVFVPLTFPDLPKVDDVEAQRRTTLRELMAWEQAPTNPARLLAAGVEVALTTAKLPERKQFPALLRRALRHGLTKEQALAALTTTPARLLGIDAEVGRLAVGQAANIQVIEGGPFEEDAVLRSLWVRGKRHVIEISERPNLDGSWSIAGLSVGDVVVDGLHFDGEHVTAKAGDKKSKSKTLRLGRRQLDFVVDASKLGGKGRAVVHALVEGDRIFGTALVAGAPVRFTASPTEADAEAEDEKGGDEDRGEKTAAADPTRELPLPLGADGRDRIPQREDVVVKNATIWTAADAGILENAALWIRNGKIAYVGPSRDLPAAANTARVVDAGGSHVTPGLIDCHSHTGIDRGINEGTQAVTAEVRIIDSLDPDDINWYRQLAGGVTAVNQLHGSANPIGGQNHVVKLRWGVDDPWQMSLAEAPQGIKFALGENVKRSRSRESTRYPGTRMGVEAIMRDRFSAARDYAGEHARYAALTPAAQRSRPAPRIDLELEALAEILRGERLVHCHSYRQDEILMLCRLAQDFGFKIGTFQHGLECYKVAEAVREAAIGASIFSDWWAYKFEVFDAIPQNGPIMQKVGIVVSFNSDSSELARRMNDEAAKAVKYGGLAPNEALKFVTRNPAIQLGIDDRVGSLEVGKDGDFAVWNGDPLSTFSRCTSTWIDGRRYFDLAEDAELRDAAAAERERLIAKILEIKPDDEPGAGIDVRRFSFFGEEDFDSYGNGTDQRGVCGCEEVR